MSTIIRAVIAGVMQDLSCVEESLARLGMSHSVRGDQFVLANGVTIERATSGLILSHSDDVQVGKFVQAFASTYRAIVEARIAALRLEEARLREEVTLQAMDETARRLELIQLQADRQRLELAQRQERQAMRQLCEEKAVAIRKAAEARGFTVREEVRGPKRILVLVRHSS